MSLFTPNYSCISPKFLLVIFPAIFQGNPCSNSTGIFDNNYNCIHAYGIMGTLPVVCVGSNPRFRTIGKLFSYYW